MADGDNEKELARVKAEAKELKEKVSELEAELEKQQKIVDNAEKKFNEMAEETGDNRKAATAAMKDLLAVQKDYKKVVDDLRHAQEALAKKVDEVGPEGSGGNNQRKTLGEQIEEAENGLTTDEQAALAEATKDISDDELKEFRASGKDYLDFINQFRKEHSNADAGLPSWRKKPAQSKKSPGGDETELRKKMFALLKDAQKSADNVPDGPSGGGGPSRRQQAPERPAMKPATHIVGAR